MLVEVFEGFYCDPELVAVVKATDEGSCAIFTAGQSAMDGGFTAPYPAKEVAQQINDALEEQYRDDEEGDEDD